MQTNAPADTARAVPSRSLRASPATPARSTNAAAPRGTSAAWARFTQRRNDGEVPAPSIRAAISAASIGLWRRIARKVVTPAKIPAEPVPDSAEAASAAPSARLWTASPASAPHHPQLAEAGVSGWEGAWWWPPE